MAAIRRLTAILAADMVGYSRLMGLEQAGTARALRANTGLPPIRSLRSTAGG
jgi:hypothetical protein